MKKLLTLLLFFVVINAKGDSWVQKASFPGGGLSYTFSFTIGNKGYVGCGRDSVYSLYNDFWEYDPVTNVWTQMANFGGTIRCGATGFSIGNKGYAGLGGNPSGGVFFQDFWEYNPVNNVWIQRANFAGGNRWVAIGFSVGGMGYVSTGLNGSTTYNDLWQYNPITDSWMQKTSLSGLPRRNASCFVIGNYGYAVGGLTQISGGVLTDSALWEYNSILDSWSQKANFPSAPRVDAAAFTICDKGYFGMGEGPIIQNFLNDLWQYNPVANSWVQKASFPNSSRDETAYFTIGNKGYIGLGGHTSGIYNDFYEYTPDSACTTGIEEQSSNPSFNIYPNPAKGEITVSSEQLKINSMVEIKIFNTDGKTVLLQHHKTTANNFKLPIANLPTGIYFVQLSEGEKRAVRKMVVE